MDYKQIRMLGAGPNNNRVPGECVIVDRVRAEMLIAGGHATEFAEFEKDENGEVKEVEPKPVNTPNKRTTKPRASKKPSKG